MKKLWNSREERENAQELIDALFPFINDKGMVSNPYTILVRGELKASLNKNTKLNRIGEISIIPTLVELKAEKKHTVQDFEQTYPSIKASFHRKINKPEKRWLLFIPFDLRTKNRKIQILGKKFSIVEKDDLLKKLDIGLFKSKISSFKAFPSEKDKFIDNLPFYFLQSEIYAAQYTQLWKKVESYYDLLRGVVDYSMQYGTYHLRFGTPFSKRTFLGLPTLAIAIDDKKKLEVIDLLSDSNQKFKPIEFSSAQDDNFKFISSLFDHEINDENSIESLMADCFRLYGQSMDSIHDYQAFISLWQIAERITLNAKSQEVADKLNALNKDKLPGSRSKYSLNILAKKRNDIVHRGIHNLDEDDLTILKLNCENALQWLIHNRDQIKTIEHLEAFHLLQDWLVKGEKKQLVREETLSFFLTEMIKNKT
ncbi:MAG: hypothetical protein RIG62_01480 [Cyclobacteriaceae bacterium]